MKKTMTMGAVAVVLMAAVSCTETETGIEPQPGNDGGQVSLGVAANLKVDAGTRASTKSVVSGDAITYPKDKFSVEAPGLGVLVTNSSVNGWYTPDGGANWHHIWYMGDEKGAGWRSIKSKGSTYVLTKEEPYYLTKTVGKVYAYYPFDEDVTSSLTNIGAESDLKIPVTVLATGAIDATANNAKKYWNNGTWSTNKNSETSLSVVAEKDYLYFDATEGGRNVNNGRAEGKTPVGPEDDPNNLDADNPGYKINLNMKHAMAMVSFRVYDGGHLSENAVRFTRFEIKNHAGGSNVFKTGTGKMALTDGTISENTAPGTLSRTITNYTLMRQVEAGGTEGEQAFISSSSINGQTVSRSVSALVYPISDGFGDTDIDVEVTLVDNGNTVVYPVTLPGNSWSAGENYIYTFSAGRNKLTVVDVTVEEWVPVDQDEIPL